MIDSNHLDCVWVCVPNSFHREIALRILESGIHVVCEKPLSTNPQHAWEMVRAANERGVFLKTASNHRYMPNVQRAREILLSGEIGKPIFLRGFIGHRGTEFHAPWFLQPELSGGGTLIDNGVHLLDLSRWFLGEATECIGLIDTRYMKTATVEDQALAIFRIGDNACVSINCSWTEWYGYLYFEVYGEKGFLTVDCRRGNKLTYGLRSDDQINEFDFTGLPPQSYRLEAEQLVSYLREKRQPEPSGEDGARVIEMVDAVYRSSKLKQWVRLPERRAP